MDTHAVAEKAAQDALNEVKSKDEAQTISTDTLEVLDDAAALCDRLAGCNEIPQPLRKKALAAGSNLAAIIAYAQKEARDRIRGNLYAKK